MENWGFKAATALFKGRANSGFINLVKNEGGIIYNYDQKMNMDIGYNLID